jgi:hypothetical protein
MLINTKSHEFTQSIVIILMLTNQKIGKLYLSGAGTTNAEAMEGVPGRVFSSNPEWRTTLFFFRALSMEARARCTTDGGAGTAEATPVAGGFPSMDNVIPLPLPLQGGEGGGSSCGHASSHGNATWGGCVRDAGATGAVDWDAAASPIAGGWTTGSMEARGRRGKSGS